MYFAHRARRLDHPVILHIVTTFACVMLLVGLLAVGWSQAAAPVMAQTTNQTYDCGSYGAGNYGANDCVTAGTTPTPVSSTPAAATPTIQPTQPTGNLPGTGAQLLWSGVIGLGLILLGVGLYYRRQRKNSPRSLGGSH